MALEACTLEASVDSFVASDSRSNVRDEPTSSAKAKPSDDEMTELVSLQKSNGMFEISPNTWNDSVFDTYAGSYEKVNRSCPDGVDFNLWLTSLAIKILEIKMGEKKELWELVVQKSKKYIRGQLMNNDEQFRIILEKAEECIRNN